MQTHGEDSNQADSQDARGFSRHGRMNPHTQRHEPCQQRRLRAKKQEGCASRLAGLGEIDQLSDGYRAHKNWQRQDFGRKLLDLAQEGRRHNNEVASHMCDEQCVQPDEADGVDVAGDESQQDTRAGWRG